MRDTDELFTPDKKITTVTTSTPRNCKVEIKKLQNRRADFKKNSPSAASGSKSNPGKTGKRNRSGPTGSTPEGKKAHETGISDESALAVGEFTASLESIDDSLDVIEKEINGNKSGLKRSTGPTTAKREDQAPPKIPKMGKRTGIELRFYKRLEKSDGSLSREEWDDAKARIQEFLFDQELYGIFDKIQGTPHNGKDEPNYGVLTFTNEEDLDDVYKRMTEVRFKTRITLRAIKPSRWLASFRIHGMTKVDPRKVFEAIMKMNGLAGIPLNVEARLSADGSGRYFTVTPDDMLLEDLRRREEEGARLKTGFNSTTIRVYNAEEKKE